MMLWREICSSKLLAKANLILFFNKVSAILPTRTAPINTPFRWTYSKLHWRLALRFGDTYLLTETYQTMSRLLRSVSSDLSFAPGSLLTTLPRLQREIQDLPRKLRSVSCRLH